MHWLKRSLRSLGITGTCMAKLDRSYGIHYTQLYTMGRRPTCVGQPDGELHVVSESCLVVRILVPHHFRLHQDLGATLLP